MNFIYDFPEKSYFGRNISKKKIYEYSSPKKTLKDLFTSQIDKITWSYKLSPETINLPAKAYVQEIQVFYINLKSESLDDDVLQLIDRSVPSPILFILSFNKKIRYAASYKRRNEADKDKWVLSSYFQTEWISEDSEKKPLPVVLDLEKLYHSFLKEVIYLSSKPDEAIEELVFRSEKLRILEREKSRTELRLNKEKQFNRKVEINTELKILEKEIMECLGTCP